MQGYIFVEMCRGAIHEKRMNFFQNVLRKFINVGHCFIGYNLRKLINVWAFSHWKHF